jgi:hypothetical protein
VRTPTATGRALAALLTAAVLTGCSAGGTGTSTSTPSATASASSTRSPQIPADGVTLAALGYKFGPTAELSLPRSSNITAVVDQANNVTAVLSSPPAAELAGYLRRNLPLAGFTITGDNEQTAQPAITFTGHGWSGSFTGDARACAVLLRPG